MSCSSCRACGCDVARQMRLHISSRKQGSTSMPCRASSCAKVAGCSFPLRRHITACTSHTTLGHRGLTLVSAGLMATKISWEESSRLRKRPSEAGAHIALVLCCLSAGGPECTLCGSGLRTYKRHTCLDIFVRLATCKAFAMF